MTMTLDVLINGSAVAVDRAVFTALFDNSVAGTYAGYTHALESGSITLPQLRQLAARGDIPYPLFFAPLPLVLAQIETKTQKLLSGISKETFAISSRATVELRDVELIVKDLVRKQEVLRTHDPTLVRNRIVGILNKLAPSPEDDAVKLMSAIGLSNDAIRACRTKSMALELFIERLETNQVLVSRSVQHYMPQRLTHVRFSGMSIRDNKVPYIFLTGGDHGDNQEPEGRTLFTLALMSVLIARRVFAPMTWDGGSTEMTARPEYDIAGAMLMPKMRIAVRKFSSLEDIHLASDEFKVTPSAVTVRAMRLGLISSDAARSYLDRLNDDYRKIPKGGPRSAILPENAVRKYGGKELSRRMLVALDTRTISAGDFCRTVCLNRIKPSQIVDLRRAVS